MEESENENPPELNSMIIKIFAFADFLSSDPLFSTFSTLYIVILLYLPRIFLRVAFSPVLIITLTLLLTLLRFGATQRNENRENNENKGNNNDAAVKSESLHEDHDSVTCKDPDRRFEEKFVEWNVRAPLEVIYETYEGEEGEDQRDESKDPNNDGKDSPRFGLERHPSLSLYYPESDSDSSSDGDFDWGSLESVCFRWEDEDREGLIEIALDDGVDNSSYNNNNNNKKRDLDHLVENFHGEEENNLIEIDISPAKQDGKWRFSGED
ncbi:hypothetical protein ACOSQ4_012285 [Xanthoceras sorbifolium]